MFVFIKHFQYLLDCGKDGVEAFKFCDLCTQMCLFFVKRGESTLERLWTSSHMLLSALTVIPSDLFQSYTVYVVSEYN
jgi:hypothetical protein